MTTRDFHPVADIFPMMSDRELLDLVQDIREHGLHEPVWLHSDGRVIDGRNRSIACTELCIEPETRTYEGDDSGLVAFVVSLNLHRRHLSESQRAMVAARIANLSQGERSDRAANLPVSQEDAAEMLSVSERSIRSARAVQDSGVPELVDAVDSGKVAVSTAAAIATVAPEVQREVIAADDEKEIIRRAKEIKQQRKEERIKEKAKKVAEIAQRMPTPLDNLGPFPVLYVDPPWRYDYAEDTSRQIENHYPTMPLDDIKKLDVPAADDSVLFLWVTSPKLLEGIEVLEAWGFEYRTCMVWVKDKIGMGYYARQQHELLLVGKRGTLPVPDPEDRPSSVIQAPRGEHSAKPDDVYVLIERMYPLREKCEMFQRRPRAWLVRLGQPGMNIHDFDASLAYSHSQADQPWWEQVYRKAFPDMASMLDLRQDGWHQRAGRDRAVILTSGRAIYIDEKVRSETYDDVAIEVWSVYPKGGAAPYKPVVGAKNGWAREPKDCDWLAYAFEPAQICYLFPFLGVRAALEKHKRVWVDSATAGTNGFRWVRSPNRTYDTISIAVPIWLLQDAISNAMTVTWGEN